MKNKCKQGEALCMSFSAGNNFSGVQLFIPLFKGDDPCSYNKWCLEADFSKPDSSGSSTEWLFCIIREFSVCDQ